ncbi:unnamed protein product [Amoebophrya sp. A25]|nr:unnamed protein product [Amoebophrya sp. A25]|eukprot:GSA25T00020754001.1
MNQMNNMMLNVGTTRDQQPQPSSSVEQNPRRMFLGSSQPWLSGEDLVVGQRRPMYGLLGANPAGASAAAYGVLRNRMMRENNDRERLPHTSSRASTTGTESGSASTEDGRATTARTPTSGRPAAGASSLAPSIFSSDSYNSPVTLLSGAGARGPEGFAEAFPALAASEEWEAALAIGDSTGIIRQIGGGEVNVNVENADDQRRRFPPAAQLQNDEQERQGHGSQPETRRRRARRQVAAIFGIDIDVDDDERPARQPAIFDRGLDHILAPAVVEIPPMQDNNVDRERQRGRREEQAGQANANRNGNPSTSSYICCETSKHLCVTGCGACEDTPTPTGRFAFGAALCALDVCCCALTGVTIPEVSLYGMTGPVPASLSIPGFVHALKMSGNTLYNCCLLGDSCCVVTRCVSWAHLKEQDDRGRHIVRDPVLTEFYLAEPNIVRQNPEWARVERQRLTQFHERMRRRRAAAERGMLSGWGRNNGENGNAETAARTTEGGNREAGATQAPQQQQMMLNNVGTTSGPVEHVEGRSPQQRISEPAREQQQRANALTRLRGWITQCRFAENARQCWNHDDNEHWRDVSANCVDMTCKPARLMLAPDPVDTHLNLLQAYRQRRAQLLGEEDASTRNGRGQERTAGSGGREQERPPTRRGMTGVSDFRSHVGRPLLDTGLGEPVEMRTNERDDEIRLVRDSTLGLNIERPRREPSPTTTRAPRQEVMATASRTAPRESSRSTSARDMEIDDVEAQHAENTTTSDHLMPMPPILNSTFLPREEEQDSASTREDNEINTLRNMLLPAYQISPGDATARASRFLLSGRFSTNDTTSTSGNANGTSGTSPPPVAFEDTTAFTASRNYQVEATRSLNGITRATPAVYSYTGSVIDEEEREQEAMNIRQDLEQHAENTTDQVFISGDGNNRLRTTMVPRRVAPYSIFLSTTISVYPASSDEEQNFRRSGPAFSSQTRSRGRQPPSRLLDDVREQEDETDGGTLMLPEEQEERDLYNHADDVDMTGVPSPTNRDRVEVDTPAGASASSSLSSSSSSIASSQAPTSIQQMSIVEEHHAIANATWSPEASTGSNNGARGGFFHVPPPPPPGTGEQDNMMPTVSQLLLHLFQDTSMSMIQILEETDVGQFLRDKIPLTRWCEPQMMNSLQDLRAAVLYDDVKDEEETETEKVKEREGVQVLDEHEYEEEECVD